MFIFNEKSIYVGKIGSLDELIPILEQYPIVISECKPTVLFHQRIHSVIIRGDISGLDDLILLEEYIADIVTSKSDRGTSVLSWFYVEDMTTLDPEYRDHPALKKAISITIVYPPFVFVRPEDTRTFVTEAASKILARFES